MPGFSQSCPDAGTLGFSAFAWFDGGKAFGLVLGQFEQGAVADEVGDPEIGQAGLTRAEEFAGAAHGEIKLRELEAILGADHGIQSFFSLFRHALSSDEDAVAFGRATADAAAQLMQLCEAEALSVFDDHYRCIGNVDADFNYGCRHEHVDFAALESAHDDFLLVRVEAAMEKADS